MPTRATVDSFAAINPILIHETRLLLSPHAHVRLQQRGIRKEVLECLLAYGRREHDHHQCEVVYFDVRSVEFIRRELGLEATQLVCDHREVYAVVDSNGCIVTTGHRYKRIKRDKSLASYRSGRRHRHRPRAAQARTAFFG